MMVARFFVLAVLFLFALPPDAFAQGLPTAQPEAVGMSSERLNRIDPVLNACVAEDCLPGIVALVARNGRTVYYKSFGELDLEENRPMPTDAIFRIASMTKPITSVAVMMLYEEGRLLLDDPISKYIPEFKDPQVLASFNPSDTTFTTEPAKREITIHDLLTHTSGIAYGFIDRQLGPVFKKYDVPDGFETRPVTLGEKMRVLADLPLASQPGEKFVYGLNTDVLGYLVEVVSGMPFDRFLRERIFEPLRMDDTYFYLPPDKADRLATVYHEEDGRLMPFDADDVTVLAPHISVNYPVVGARTYFSGGAGLSSTASDYARFSQMLLNGGELDGARILGPKTVELMFQDHLGEIPFGAGRTFGLGFEIIENLGRYGDAGSVGITRWGGYWHTQFWIDPKENLIAVYMSQVNPTTHGDVFEKFRALTYQAIVESNTFGSKAQHP